MLYDYLTSIKINSLTDLGSWDFYEKYRMADRPKYPGNHNPHWQAQSFAWHMDPRSVFPHTRRHRMMLAICEDDVREVKRVLDEGYNINETVVDLEKGYSAMSLSAELNRTTILDYLILRGGNVNKKDSADDYPISYAVRNWHFDSIKQLVNRGADASVTNKFGKSLDELAHAKKQFAISEYIKECKVKQKEQKAELPKFTTKLKIDELINEDNNKMVNSRRIFSGPQFYPFNNLIDTFHVTLNVDRNIEPKTSEMHWNSIEKCKKEWIASFLKRYKTVKL